MGSIKANVKYRASGDSYRADGIDLISSDTPKYGEPNKLNRIVNPVQVPASGDNYSHEKWVSFECTVAPLNAVSEIKVWGDSDPPRASVAWFARVQSNYEMPELVSSIISVSGTGTITIAGTNITGTGTNFETDFADGQLLRVPAVSHLFQPKTINSNRSLTLFNRYSGSVVDSSYMIEPYGQVDVYFDGSDDWHKLSISGTFAEEGDEHGHLVLVEKVSVGANLGECPSVENDSRIYYNWEGETGVDAPYSIIDGFTPAFDYRPSVSGTDEIVVGDKDSTIQGIGDNLFGENFQNFNAYQGTIYGHGKIGWAGTDNKEHYLIDIKNGDYRLFLKKTQDDNTFKFSITDGLTSSTAQVSSVTLTQGQRYWFFARWDSANTVDGTNYLKLTINGTSQGSTDIPPVIDLPANINWFQDYNGLNKWVGAVMMGIEERAWADSEVSEFYNSGMGIPWSASKDLKGLLVGESDASDNPEAIQFPQSGDYGNEITDADQEDSPSWTTDTNVTDAASTTRKYGRKSRELTWGAGAATNEKAYMATGVLEDATDYMYDIWVYVTSLSDNIYLRISPNSGFTSYCVNRRIDTGKDDDGTTYATGTWLHYQGTFRTGGNKAHYIGLAKVGTGGGAVVLVDKIRIHKSDFESPHCWLWEDVDINWEDMSYNWETLI